MWFKLASATFGTHLGSMASLSNSISIKYTANGFSYTTNSVSKTASSASLVLNLMSGWECKSTPTVSVSGAAVVNGTPTWSNNKLTIAIKPASSKSTFEAAGTIINVSVSGATAISSGGSGGTNPPANPPSGDSGERVTIAEKEDYNVNGFCRPTNGTFGGTDSTYKRTDYIDITAYSALYAYCQPRAASVSPISFFTADQTWISGITPEGDLTTQQEFIVEEIPEGAVYAIFSGFSSSNPLKAEGILK